MKRSFLNRDLHKVYLSAFRGFSDEVLAMFATEITVNIILITVQELEISLNLKPDLTKILSAEVMALDKPNDLNKPIFNI